MSEFTDEEKAEMNKIYLRLKAIEETIDIISDENGWEETRDYWKKKLLNNKQS